MSGRSEQPPDEPTRRPAPAHPTHTHHATVVNQQGPHHSAWRSSPGWRRYLRLQEFTYWQESLSASKPTGEWTWRVCRLLCVCPGKPCRHSFSKLRHVPRPTSPAGGGQGGKGTGITALPSKLSLLFVISGLIWVLCRTFSRVHFVSYFIYIESSSEPFVSPKSVFIACPRTQKSRQRALNHAWRRHVSNQLKMTGWLNASLKDTCLSCCWKEWWC